MKRRKKACAFYATIDGKDSKLYKGLLNEEGLERPFTNYIYAKYIASNMAEEMDRNEYKRNSQNQHDAKDVLKFIEFDKMLDEMRDTARAAYAAKAVDINGIPINYTDGREALGLADDFNNSHNALVAIVTKPGDFYNISIENKDATNHMAAVNVKKRIAVWDAYKQAFDMVGVDINNLPPEAQKEINPFNLSTSFPLQNLARMSFGDIGKQQAMTLFSLNSNIHQVENLNTQFGSMEEAAAAFDNLGGYEDNQILVLKRAIAECQKFQGIDLNALKDRVSQISSEIEEESEEIPIEEELHKLNKQCHIKVDEIDRINTDINTYADAVSDAIFVLERQIREITSRKGDIEEGKRLEKIQHQLISELKNKRYHAGLLAFLSEASSQAAIIDDLIKEAPQTGTELQKVFADAAALRKVKQIKDQYYALATALANENVKIDEKIDQIDIDRIREAAKELKTFFENKEEVIRKLTENTMAKLLTIVIGNKTSDGQLITNVVKMAAVDSTWMDFLYSVGRVSNPIINAMGGIIREAQTARDQPQNAIKLRIRRATNKLYKSGHNSEFMYEDDGHIISDIDWTAFQKARSKFIGQLKKQHLGEWDFRQKLREWDAQNMEDRLVDKNTGRTEKVPNNQYRKDNGMKWNNTAGIMEFSPSSGLTQAQQEYYNEMMKLKGEIGSLLPAYAQDLYLPPQIRRSMTDAILHAKNAKDVWKAISNKFMNLWTIREDDPNFYLNGVIKGEDAYLRKSTDDNKALREIPIFYINKVEQGELLKDFSSGLQTLASTALNYNAMNNIIDVVEFMGDFVKEQGARNKKQEVDVVDKEEVRIIKRLLKWGRNVNTDSLVDGFIAQHLYGQRYAPGEHTWKVKLWNNIIGYTSFRGLSTNFKGMFSNYLMGEFQMMIEAGAGEFYGFKDFGRAHLYLFGTGAGVPGEIMELLTNNMNHRATLFREMFDPMNDNFSETSRTRYYKSAFRQLVSHDCSFIGYSSGEYLIHYVNMYAVLMHEKVLLNGREISLFDAFEVVNRENDNSELKLKDGVTDTKGNPITKEFLDTVKAKIRYVNQTTHGSMNAEDKGLIHRYWWGRGVMNFRQWMVEHYSRRFRGRHFDDSLKQYREGYWVSYRNAIWSEDTAEAWKEGAKKDAMIQFMKDFCTFSFRAQSQWTNLSDMEKYNVQRVRTEMLMFISMLGLSFALGEPDEHKKEFWRRWWIYHTKRTILETEASMPHPKALSSAITIFQSPMAGIDTLNSLLYVYNGLANGDILKEIKSGPHKGENRYWRNVKKNVLPFYKDWEQIQNMDTDDAIFKIFEDSPGRR